MTYDCLGLYPEAPQQFFAHRRWDGLLRWAPEGLDGLLHLSEIDAAPKAHAQVQGSRQTRAATLDAGFKDPITETR